MWLLSLYLEWEGERERENENELKNPSGRTHHEVLPPLENCDMIQRAMWTKLGSSDCMNFNMNSMAEGLDSSRALWYSAV